MIRQTRQEIAELRRCGACDDPGNVEGIKDRPDSWKALRQHLDMLAELGAHLPLNTSPTDRRAAILDRLRYR